MLRKHYTVSNTSNEELIKYYKNPSYKKEERGYRRKELVRRGVQWES